jgi:hypothetical protein
MLASSKSLKDFLGRYAPEVGVLETIEQATFKAKFGDVTIHPYGFYIIKTKVESLKQIRLHIWLPNIRRSQNPDWPPHNHNYDLDSIVIKGRLRHNIWDVKEVEVSRSILYQVSYDVGVSKLTKTHLFSSCEKSRTLLYEFNESYHLRRYSYHSVEVANDIAAVTLCIMTNPGNETQHVVGDMRGRDEYHFSRRSVSSEEQRLVAQELECIQQVVSDV